MSGKKLYLKMMFDNGKSFLGKFKRLGEAKLYEFILLNCDKQTMMWTCNSITRQNAAIHSDISEDSINRYLRDMVKSGLLLHEIRSVYKVNPKFIDHDLNGKLK